MPKVRAVYPGSFDPPTLGHIDIINRSAKIFDLTVLVAESSKKQSLFSSEERKKLLEQSIDSTNVKVQVFSGLTTDYLKKNKMSIIIRGLRAVSDFEYELAMATVNRKLFPQVETLVIMTDEKYHYIASSMVKEVAAHGGDLSQLVPKVVVKALEKIIQAKLK